MPSIRENIIQDVKQTLEDMSAGAGYHYDWEHVYLFPPSQIHAYPSALVSENGERQADLAYPKIERVLEIEIYGIHRVITSVADAPSTSARQLIADLERALMQDPTRGDNAVDSRLLRTEPPLLGDDWVQVVVVIEVVYHTSRTDPNSEV